MSSSNSSQISHSLKNTECLFWANPGQSCFSWINPKCPPEWVDPFPTDVLRTPCFHLMPCDLDDVTCAPFGPSFER